MAGENTVASLNANFKQVYGKLKDLVPNQFKFSKIIPFQKGEKQLGNQFNEPIILGLEGGITYGGEEGLAFNLNSFVSFPLRNAQVKSSEMVLRSAISTAMASRSQKNSFERGMKLLSGNMLKSMYHRLEISLIYGRKGLGKVKSISGNTVTLYKSEWAAGIWVGTNKHKIDFFDSALAAQSGSSKEIQSYDLALNSITLDNVTGISVDDVIFFQGAVVAGVTPTHNDMIGLHAIAEANTSLFGINNSAEPLFQGNIVSVGTNNLAGSALLSFAKIEEGVSAIVEKGFQNDKLTCYVNVNSWSDLMTEQAAKVSYDQSYDPKQAEDGFESLKFHGQAGVIEIVPHTFVKEGFAYIFCEKDLERIGSSDITFEPPGYEGEFFKMLEGASGYEIRAYSDQALFTSRPSSICILRYIKNSRRGNDVP